jgi:hypothetical protein
LRPAIALPLFRPARKTKEKRSPQPSRLHLRIVAVMSWIFSPCKWARVRVICLSIFCTAEATCG